MNLRVSPPHGRARRWSLEILIGADCRSSAAGLLVRAKLDDEALERASAQLAGGGDSGSSVALLAAASRQLACESAQLAEETEGSITRLLDVFRGASSECESSEFAESEREVDECASASCTFAMPWLYLARLRRPGFVWRSSSRSRRRHWRLKACSRHWRLKAQWWWLAKRGGSMRLKAFGLGRCGGAARLGTEDDV